MGGYSGLGLGLAIRQECLAELARWIGPGQKRWRRQGNHLIMSLPISVVRTLDTGENRQHSVIDKSDARLHTPSLKGVKVMVVDDEIDALGLVKRILERLRRNRDDVYVREACLNSLPTLRPKRRHHGHRNGRDGWLPP